MAKSRLWGLLGDIEFTLALAPEGFSHERRVTLPEHEVIEDRPSVQWTGWKLETLRLTFNWHVGWCDPDEQLLKLWAAQDKHEPMRLVLGSGTWKRKWLIESVSDSLTHTDPFGDTLAIEATVSLKESGRTVGTQARPTGIAVRDGGGIVALARRAA